MYSATVVKDKGTELEQRPFLGWTFTQEEAKWLIRDAIAWGFDYGYIKQAGGQIVASYNESSFKPKLV